MSAFPTVSDLRNLLNPYQDIDNAKPQDKPLEKCVGNQGTELWVQIQQVIILPISHPRETEQSHPEFKPNQDVNAIE